MERPTALALVRGQVSQKTGPQRGPQVLAVGTHGVGYPQGQHSRVQMLHLFQLLQGHQWIVDHFLSARRNQQIPDLVAELYDRNRLLERNRAGDHGSRHGIIPDDPHHFFNQVFFDVYVVPPIGHGDLKRCFAYRFPSEPQRFQDSLYLLQINFHAQHPLELGTS